MPGLLGFGIFNWGWNQLHNKPATDYGFNGTNSIRYGAGFGGIFTNYIVTNSEESRAMVARSRTVAIGAVGPSGVQTNQGAIRSAVDAGNLFDLGSSDSEHGAIFDRPIQTILDYYQSVLDSIGY